METDLFGSILYLAVQRKIDRGSSCLASNTQFAKVNETPMSTLMKELQKPSVSNNLEMFNVVIFKGMLFLHLLSYFT